MSTLNIHTLANAITLALRNGSHLFELKRLLEQYDDLDWHNFVEINQNKYTKKLVFGNDLFDIHIISWNTNQKSNIHDHPDNGCLFKLLDGQLTEYLYDTQLKLLQTKCLGKGDISYIQGKQGLHSITNSTLDNIAVSLHIYSPPNYKPLFY